MRETTEPCAAVTRSDGWAAIPNAVLAASGRAIKVYAILARHADRRGRAWPSQEHLAVDAGCDARTVRRGLAELRELGAIAKVGTVATRGGAVDVYAVGDAVAEDLEGLEPVDGQEVADTSVREVADTSVRLNETQGNEKPLRAPARVCETPPTPTRASREGLDSVEELLEHLPDPVRRSLTLRQRRGLRRQLARALEHRSLKAVAKAVTGADWPPLQDARNAGGALAHRLAVVADTEPPPSSSGCRECDGADLEVLASGDVLKACRAHRLEAVAA